MNRSGHCCSRSSHITRAWTWQAPWIQLLGACNNLHGSRPPGSHHNFPLRSPASFVQICSINPFSDQGFVWMFNRLLVLFCCINLLNYLDRGTIASNGVNGVPGDPGCLKDDTCFHGSGIQYVHSCVWIQLKISFSS